MKGIQLGRMKSLLLLTGMMSGVLAGSTRADESAKEVLGHVREKYEDIADARLTFSQTVTFSRTGLEQRSSGTLFLKKEHHYRLEAGDRTVVTDGTTVWSYSRASGQVIIDHFEMDERTLSPEKILTGAADDFEAVSLGEEAEDGLNRVVLKLTPKSGDSFVASMKLWIDDGRWLIRKAEVSELNGRTTLYQIIEIDLNTGLDEDVFRFSPPEGADIVDLR